MYLIIIDSIYLTNVQTTSHKKKLKTIEIIKKTKK